MTRSGSGDSRIVGLALAGLVVGALIAWFVPSHWLWIESSHEHAEATDDGTSYVCPMFCVVLDELPDDDLCPVCGMVLEAWAPGGSLEAAAQWMVGLEVASLERRSLERVIRQIGEVDYDETRITSVTTRVAGYLESVAQNETWQTVSAGDELASIYSPELFAAQGEYLVAYERAGRPASLDAVEDAGVRASLRATESRLRNLGIQDADLASLRERREPQRTLALRAPRDGVLIRRNVTVDTAVAVGDELYVIADLSRVWILVEVFESELPWIAIGQPVDLLTETLPGRVIQGTVDFVDPVFDRVRRTARVRVAVDNPHQVENGRRLFQPGQRVDARIRAGLGTDGRIVRGDSANEAPPPVLAIPKDAVLRTGTRAVTYVLRDDSDGGSGYDIDPKSVPETVGYELVEIRIGALARETGSSRGDRYYPLLGVVAPDDDEATEDGGSIGLRRLRPGHVVVRKGNFLIDSQAQLSGMPSLLVPEGRGASSSAGADATNDPHAGH